MTENTSILLVDDDETFTRILERGLRRRGHDIHIAHNGEDACLMLDNNDIDSAVVDLKLAQESGLKLIPKLLAVNPGINIVILTGYSSVSTAVEAIKLGAHNYLCKPATVDEILAAFDKTETLGDSKIPDKPTSLNRLEWEHIQKVLDDNDGNISATARALNMHRRTLQRKLQKRPVRH
ncbi:MAG: response regulator transcription factor [Pseudomonadales bacterium]|nr:response regulator transcription factor [Pseudomonadales bacterium]